MKVTDLIAFAKAGWKPADVREFLDKIEQPQEPEQEQESPEPEAEQEPETPEPEEDPTEEEPDYKALYEAEKKQREELQKQNTRKEQPDPVSEDDILGNLVREFM